MFQVYPDYRRNFVNLPKIKSDDCLLEECGNLDAEIKHLYEGFRTRLSDKNEDYLE